jgi:hypothetical protein
VGDGQNQEKSEIQVPVFALNKPFLFEGQTYTEFPFDLDALTGDDMLSCERMMNTMTNDFVLARTVSMAFQLAIASKAAKVQPDVLRALPAKEFTRMMQRVQNFLLSWD